MRVALASKTAVLNLSAGPLDLKVPFLGSARSGRAAHRKQLSDRRPYEGAASSFSSATSPSSG